MLFNVHIFFTFAVKYKEAMNNSYIKLPFSISNLNDKLWIPPSCSKEESIAQNLMMMITSGDEEVAGREDFGAGIWELEFSLLVKTGKWEEKVRENLLYSIGKYEKRLKEVAVRVELIETEERMNPHESPQPKRRAQISVFGTISDNNMPFNFKTVLYISPLRPLSQ